MATNKVLTDIKNAQDKNYINALYQIYNCKKDNDWIWYIFPQNIYSYQNKYRIYNEETLIAYLNDEDLMKRLIKITNLVIKCLKSKIKMDDLIGNGADVKNFRFSMSLFFLGSLIINSDYKYIFAEAIYYSKNVNSPNIYNNNNYKYKDKDIYYTISNEVTNFIEDKAGDSNIDINYYLAFKNSGTENTDFNNNKENINKYKYYNKLIEININIIENFNYLLNFNYYILNNNINNITEKDNDDYSISISISKDKKIITYNSKVLNEYDKSNEIDFSKAKIYELTDNNNLNLITNINSKDELQEYNYNYYT